ncbi:uncharacterized protein V1518DRAFT_413873 [Limtongia smithiae]|uniref:uncharacterized protein n=1 Tax=Limtongia smithiae TaxID=1125753 RepID=UPI0034CEEB4E
MRAVSQKWARGARTVCSRRLFASSTAACRPCSRTICTTTIPTIVSRSSATSSFVGNKSRLHTTASTSATQLQGAVPLLTYSSIASSVYDVVIVGGGVSGLTLAAALKSLRATSNLRIALVEGFSLASARDWSPGENDFSNRVSSITPASKLYLEQRGIWDCVRAERVQEYDNMRVWDGVSGARIHFDSTTTVDFNDSAAGGSIAYMTENINLQHGLLKYLAQSAVSPSNGPAVDIFDSTKVDKMTFGPDLDDVNMSGWPQLTLSTGETLLARLLVGADGINSPVRSFAGITTRGWDYHQNGVVATLALEWDDRQRIAWQRFLPSGPIALLPMPNGYASLVWTTPPDLANHLVNHVSPTAFCALVNAAFRLETFDLSFLLSQSDESTIADEFEWRDARIPLEYEGARFPLRVADVANRASFPLRMRHCDTYIAPRIALVGDAAHTTHPLAGQGLNLGQGDVAALVDVIDRGVRQGADIGSDVLLSEYWADRYPINHAMLGAVDKLQKLYCTDCPLLVGVRSVGLEIVDNLPWVKQFLIKQASGL